MNQDNLLLRSLPPAERSRLDPLLKSRAVQAYDVLIEADQPFDHVYFPTTCMVSIVTLLENGSLVESATVGREGVVGLPVFLGLTTAICQVSGRALQMKTTDFRDAIENVPALHTALGLYTNALIAMLGQGGACNGSHTVEQRLARWLLTISDRVGDSFAITQDFLAEMVGVQRPSVNIAIATLTNTGLIAHSRSQIHILDRAGLIEASCECYEIIRLLYDETWKQASSAHGQR
jgi:CRP-like cAMP-binding protein